jgi:hypothetical protein
MQVQILVLAHEIGIALDSQEFDDVLTDAAGAEINRNMA